VAAKRIYSQDEVDAILARAIESQAKEQAGLTHDDIVNAASEVGISRDAIEAAEHELRQNDGRRSDQEILRAFKRRQKLAFARHFVVYVLVVGMLVFVNLATSTAFLWSLVAALGWGIGIAMHFMNVAFPDDERILERERRREARRARRDRWQKRGADFERAVNEGVRLLLEASQKHTARVAADEPKARVADDSHEEEEEEIDEREAARRRS